ncbi:hypothetical protein BU17DRAFT_48872 [Hysterangium stoloniferum]|nr:hypothetical protein BU17DRAFT_48872 [Hysterangium stoloniferum]
MSRHHTDTSYYTSSSRRATTKSPSYYTTSRDHRDAAYPSSPVLATSSTSTPSSQPRYASSSVSIDPLLAFHSHASNLVTQFDVSLPPSQIIQRLNSSYDNNLSPRDRARPATSPPLPFLRLKCSLLPWPIDVDPADHSGVVTVGDVFAAIYYELRRHVTRPEWEGAPADVRERVRQSWLRRCKRQQTHRDREHESSNGLRRIDWLAKDTVFQGLSPGRSRDEWVLHLRQGEKTVKFWAGS